MLISTCALLFSWKCQRLLYKREDHKRLGTWPHITVGEMRRQRSETLPRQKTQCCRRLRLFAIFTHGIIWLSISFRIMYNDTIMARHTVCKESSSFLCCFGFFLSFFFIWNSYRIRIWLWDQNMKVQNEHSKGSGGWVCYQGTIYRNRLYFLLINWWWNLFIAPRADINRNVIN